MGWFRKTANDYLLKGTEESLRGEYERAIETLSKALELDSQNAAAYWHRGIAFLESGQVEQALQDFGESLRLELSALCYYNRTRRVTTCERSFTQSRAIWKGRLRRLSGRLTWAIQMVG